MYGERGDSLSFVAELLVLELLLLGFFVSGTTRVDCAEADFVEVEEGFIFVSAEAESDSGCQDMARRRASSMRFRKYSWRAATAGSTAGFLGVVAVAPFPAIVGEFFIGASLVGSPLSTIFSVTDLGLGDVAGASLPFISNPLT